MTDKTIQEKAVERVHLERRRLEQNLARLDPVDMTRPGVIGEWSVKDILAHLAEWEEMCIGWVKASRDGITPAVPAPGFRWTDLDALNRRIYNKHCSRPLNEVLAIFRQVHEQFERLLGGMSDEELSMHGYFPWMGSSSFYRWVGVYAAHDKWAKTGIRKWMKTEGKRMERPNSR
jgi:hypothetical protein